MPDTPALRVVSGDVFRAAQGCPVASRWAHGQYVSHQGDAGSFLLADARTRDGTAAVRLALWRCVHCGTMLAGLARADGDPDGTREFTWLEEAVVLLDAGDGNGPGAGSGPARQVSGHRAGGEPGQLTGTRAGG